MLPVSDAPPEAVAHDDAVSLLDLLGVLVRRRRLIIGTTTASAVAILAYAVLSLSLPSSSPFNLLPNIFRPEAKVLLLEGSSSGLPALSAAFLGNGGLGLGQLLGGGGGGSSAALAQELLAGRTIQDQIIAEFDFFGRYELTDLARTRARGLAEQALQYEYDVESAVLSIAYEDTDPEFAAAVLTRTLELLERRFHALTMETVLLKKQHLEERLAVVGADRQAAQERLVAFHQAYGIIDIREQSLELARLLADYKRELLSKEVELQSLREFLPATDPSVVQLQSQIGIVRQVLDELQTGFRYFSAQTIPQDELPGVAADYLNLRRDLEIQEQIYALLREQYELTRIEESDPSRTFQILEAVEVPEIKHRPSRSRVCVVGTLIGFLLSVLLAFFLEYLARVRADPAEAAKLAAIRGQLGWRPRDRGAD